MWTINELCSFNQIGMAGQICMGGFLGLLTFLDLMYQRIPVWLLAAGGSIVSAIWILQGKLNGTLILAGAAVGVAFLGISFFTKEAFGYADSILILFFGVSLGVWNLMQLLFYAFGLSAIFAMVQLMRKSFSKKATYPFIPFLTIAYAGVLFL